jgi:diguanylate cyclase (GGDEF)-like protein
MMREQKQPQFLEVAPLQSIKNKLIMFALLATLIPSLTLGWLSYFQNSKILSEKINDGLLTATLQARREIGLWEKECLYDLRVFSSSYVISENLEKIIVPSSTEIERMVAVDRITDYLQSVRAKVTIYEELALIDLQGTVLTSSSPEAATVVLPPDWRRLAEEDQPIWGDSFLDPAAGSRIVVVAEAIRTSDQQLIGVLGAKINLDAIRSRLASYTQSRADEVYLIDNRSNLLVSSKPLSGEVLAAELDSKPYRDLTSQPGRPLHYESYRGLDVVGMLEPIPALNWAVIAEVERDKAYGGITRLRYLTILLVGGLLVCIWALAYFLGLSIIRPLERLSLESAKVASGDLDVEIPVKGLNEVAYLTEVFNYMVTSLRDNRGELAAANNALIEKNEELQRISITDSLTGLFNRKHLMEICETEMARSKRHKYAFALLMIDIDHFKAVNDSHGHQAGDEVLRLLSDVFSGSIRQCDYAGRYGGEEFILLLTQSSPKDGLEVAERIRAKAAGLEFASKNGDFTITVSIGVSGYPEAGDDLKDIIHRADEALYEAKKQGRNRVVAGSGLP